MKETEITAQIFESLEDIHQKLVAQGYKILRSFIMEDYYYSNIKENIKEISFQNLISQSFLIRHINEYNNNSSSINNYIIYKNKTFNENGDVVEEEKIKSEVEDYNLVVNILNKAGFNPYIINKSNNYVYNNGEIEFCIQDVENLGIFIELEELEYMHNLSPEEKTKELINILNTLNLKTGTDYNCKKVYMLIHKN